MGTLYGASCALPVLKPAMGYESKRTQRSAKSKESNHALPLGFQILQALQARMQRGAHPAVPRIC